MSEVTPQVVNLNPPMLVLGKYFQGDYSSFRDHYEEVKQILIREKVEFVPRKIVGIYYDNPDETKRSDLRSFHGVIPRSHDFSSSLSIEQLSGDYLTLSIEWSTTKTIYEGYKAIADYLKDHPMQLRSNIAYQIVSGDVDQVTMEFYFEVNPEKKLI